MDFILTGLFASFMAWVVNKLILSKEGLKGVVFFGPFTEELFKTGMALFFNTSIILTHIVFGFVEALIDYRNTNNSTVAIVSLASHTILGIITYGSYILIGNIFIAFLIAVIIHILWNRLVINIVVQKS
ncbi:MAG: hypothetical protein APF76_15635 [Desulfitibacter sp. BRH_c19]|nr:MAG: hypothetical protein APF76_15635 [Desulfitibacter sp. BRH_c19]